jgi:hypothetical protein
MTGRWVARSPASTSRSYGPDRQPAFVIGSRFDSGRRAIDPDRLGPGPPAQRASRFAVLLLPGRTCRNTGVGRVVGVRRPSSDSRQVDRHVSEAPCPRENAPEVWHLAQAHVLAAAEVERRKQLTGDGA